MSRYPVDHVDVASGYGYRQDPGGGLLPQGHGGLDLVDQAGAPVRAPEPMTVTAVWTDDKTPPYVGYGPGGIEGQGSSGLFHLLGHMDPAHLEVSVGDRVQEGEQVGAVSALGHVHWEVRRVAVDNPDTRAGDTLDPVEWLKTGAQNVLEVHPPQRKPWPWWTWLALVWIVARSNHRW